VWGVVEKMEEIWTPGRYISIIYRKCQLYLDRTLSKYGLGRGLYLCLLEISREEGLNQKSLSQRVVLDQASVTRAIRKLECKELVKRGKDSRDGRAQKLFLTKKGWNILDKVKVHLEEWDAMAIKNFTIEERELYINLLKKMASNL